MNLCQDCNDDVKESNELLCIHCAKVSPTRSTKKSKQSIIYVARETGCRDPYPPAYYQIKSVKKAEEYLRKIGLRD